MGLTSSMFASTGSSHCLEEIREKEIDKRERVDKCTIHFLHWLQNLHDLEEQNGRKTKGIISLWLLNYWNNNKKKLTTTLVISWQVSQDHL